jgi:riboflavin-specific deaminase-like protein
MTPAAQRPLVLVNMAMTADGKIATANRAVTSFSSRRDREHLLELRATADAVLSGARTVNLENVELGPGPARFRRARLARGLAESNLRIIATGSGVIRPDARVFRSAGAPVIVLTTGRAGARRLRQLRALADAVQVCGRDAIDWPAALAWLRQNWAVRRLLCEGGGELNGSLFRARVVDELHLTICPQIFGGRQAPTIADGHGFARLTQAMPCRLKSLRRIGDELFAVFAVGPARGDT